jgi:hypothetical protein|eukprot:m.213079 g.213079  ORF g.213079 m.213079 type:complete len:125 (+) comp25550_c0_seq1:1671-2045(+)
MLTALGAGRMYVQAEWTGASPFTGALVRPDSMFAVTAFVHVDTSMRGNASVDKTVHPRLQYHQSVFLLESFFITCTSDLTAVGDPNAVDRLGVRTNTEQRVLRFAPHPTPTLVVLCSGRGAARM